MKVYKNLPILILLIVSMFEVNAQSELWPGDVTNNGTANNIDLIYLGYAYGEVGPLRPNPDTSWVAQPTVLWQTMFPNSNLDVSYADCNGDGVVNQVDQAIIELNYNKIHQPFFADSIEIGIAGSDPELSISKTTIDSIFPGSIVEFEVNLGNNNIPVDNFYGMAFTISFDTSLIQENIGTNFSISSGWVDNNSSDFILSSSTSYYDTTTTNNGKFDIGLTRTDKLPALGFGQIGTFSIVMEDNITGKTSGVSTVDLSLEISNVYLLDENLVNHPVFSQNSIFTIITPTGTNDLIIDEEVKIFPNPAQNFLQINAQQLKMESVQIYNSIGQQVYFERLNGQSEHLCMLGDIGKGIFITKIRTHKGILVRKILINK